MFKKKIAYEDLDGNTVQEEFYFNLTKAELIKMEASIPGGMSEQLKNLDGQNNPAELIEVFDSLLGAAYGRRSADRKNFAKKPEWFEEFKASEAYSVLFMELIEVPGKAAEFVNSLMPQDLSEKVNLKGQIHAVQDVTLPENTAEMPNRIQGSSKEDPKLPQPAARLWTQALTSDEVKKLDDSSYHSYIDWLIARK